MLGLAEDHGQCDRQGTNQSASEGANPADASPIGLERRTKVPPYRIDLVPRLVGSDLTARVTPLRVS